MEMMNFLFNDNLGINYNKPEQFRLIKTNECLLKLKDTMINWVNDSTFTINRTKNNKRIEKTLSDVKTINTVFNYILDEMEARTSYFTFDDLVNYRHQMNEANKQFHKVHKEKLNNIKVLTLV